MSKKHARVHGRTDGNAMGARGRSCGLRAVAGHDAGVAWRLDDLGEPGRAMAARARWTLDVVTA